MRTLLLGMALCFTCLAEPVRDVESSSRLLRSALTSVSLW
jgi:hypothetical protein